MSRINKGDIITCFNVDELEVTEEGLVNDGYGFRTQYDMATMNWKILITEVGEAADD